MAYDGIMTKAVASELNLLTGARIDKIFQPNNNTVILGFYLDRINYALCSFKKTFIRFKN